MRTFKLVLLTGGCTQQVFTPANTLVATYYTGKVTNVMYKIYTLGAWHHLHMHIEHIFTHIHIVCPGDQRGGQQTEQLLLQIQTRILQENMFLSSKSPTRQITKVTYCKLFDLINVLYMLQS